jgi:YegS/Rv2252/BmrU family lipid kinase
LNETLFIINPAAARGATLRFWLKTRPVLTGLGIDLCEHVTTRPGEGPEIVREAIAQGVRRVVAVGGDGTLNEVVNGYLDESGKPHNPEAAIGLLPSGTGSDFSRSIGLRTLKDSIETIAANVTRNIDAFRIECSLEGGGTRSRYGVNAASFGLGGEAVAIVNDWSNKLPAWIGGRARFVAAAIQALRSYKNVPVTVLVDEHREMKLMSNLIIAANGRFAGGGMMFAPNARVDDGFFDLILTDGLTRFDIVKELRRIGRGGHLKNPGVSELRARDVRVSAQSPVPVEIDGETVGYTEAKLSILPGVIRLAVPPLQRSANTPPPAPVSFPRGLL